LFLTKAQLELVFPDGRRVLWPYSKLKMSRTSASSPIRLERSTAHPDLIPESVVIEDPEFLHEAHRLAPGALGTIGNQPHKRKLRYFLLILACVTLPPFIFAVWMYGIPAITDAVADQVPTEWEEKLGQDYFQTIFKETIKEPDPQVRTALDAISKRLLAAAPDQPYHFRIYVHPSKMVNAMALPGGIIIVFQGLINITETPEELAGVLAHEFQHVLKRHSTRGIIRSEAINIFATVVSGDYMMNVILQAGGMMEFLRYSRKLESQADAEGMKMVLAARVDPEGMIRIFEKLEENQHRQIESPKKDKKKDKNKDKKKADSQDKNSAEKPSTDKKEKNSDNKDLKLPEWTKYLSTHPAGEDRVEVLKKLSKHTTQKPKPLLPGFDWKTMYRATKDSKEPGFIF
ncbi:MAG: M48 family metallopeptidase, partial [Nitrospinaceae bacterium]